jgi:hypothetical protein
MLIKQKTLPYWLFVLCGGKFYLDWLLITNPTSKNPIFRFLWGKNIHIWMWEYKRRMSFCFIFGGIHIFYNIISIPPNQFFTISNILVNVYPIIVQLYIYYRCHIIIKTRSKSQQIS